MMRLRVGVIGDPVAHSLSPIFQQPALEALGIDATYERWHTTLEELPQRVESLRGENALGANVTVPHKEAVIPLLDDIDPLAQRAGAVNTIVPRQGRLRGHNTDIYGLARSLEEACPDVGTRRVVLLGAGGAARGAVLALDQLGVTTIVIANRSPDRAARLVAELDPISLTPISISSPDLYQELASAGVVINATSLGWREGDTVVPSAALDMLGPGALVMDLTYRDTPLLQAAAARDLATLDGLAMLVYQGARSLELWTGQEAPVDLMMQAALNARAAAS